MGILTLITAVVSENLKSLLNSLLKEFGEEVKQVVNNNILEYQVEEYNRNYCTKANLLNQSCHLQILNIKFDQVN